MDKKNIFYKRLQNKIIASNEVHKKLLDESDAINSAVNKVYLSLKNEGKIMFCGNGGSAADAQHLTAELLIRLRPNVNRQPFPAISLAQDTSTLTACGNDYDFTEIFLRPFKALAKKNDLLFVISTSGNSKNILKVLKYAKSKNISTVGLLGGNGGKAKKLCSVNIIVPSKVVATIQECHIFLGQYILEVVEDKLLRSKSKKK
jgi:D-sedoheptulose 7-phosphate isomerase